MEVWNEIYASRQTNMILQGIVNAVEELDDRPCLIIIKDDAKIIIPEEESGIEKPNRHIIHSIIGAEIDFVVRGINREAGIAVASRRFAMEQKKKTELPKLKAGSIETARVVSVGKSRAVFELAGVEVKLHTSEIFWTYVDDLRDMLYNGQTVKVLVKEVDPEAGTLQISVKEAEPNPFDRNIQMHKVGGQYLAEITGVVEWGIFVRFSTNIEALCPHTNMKNYRPTVGDKVLVIIREIDPNKKRVKGYIIRPVSRKMTLNVIGS